MSLSPIGSAVFELLSHKHTYIQTYRQTDILLLYSKDVLRHHDLKLNLYHVTYYCMYVYILT